LICISVNLLESDIIATITVIMSKGQYSLAPAPVFACACACACALIFVDLILSSQTAHFLPKKFQA
jgi:hypothetical protein